MRPRFLLVLTMCLLLTLGAIAQSVPNIVKFSGVAKEASGHVAGMMFTVYKDQKGGSILWQEMQNVTVDADGHYTVLLGSASASGLGATVFADGQARWIGVKVEGHAEHERMLLATVPYSMKAQDASTLNGMTAEELIAQSIQSFRQQNQGPKSSSIVMAPTADISAPVLQASTIAAALITTTATTFSDTNTNQVVQVTQLGTGAALRANTASTTNNAIYGINTSTTGSVRGVYGETNSSATSSAGVFGQSKALTGLNYGVLGITASASGTALNGTATSTTGTAIGLRGQSNASAGTGVEAAEASTTGFTTGVNAFVNSASGVAGVFDNRAGGQILSLDNNGNEVLSVDGSGNTIATGGISVSGATFVVDGTGNLTAGTVPQARVTGLAASLTSATTSANTYTDGQISTEVTNRNSAIAVETTNRTNADSALSTSITNETTARTAADALKANLAGGNTFTTGKQTLAAPAAGFASLNLPGSATAPTTPAVGDLWLGTGNIHPRFVDNTSTTQSLAFLTDITTASTAANTYTDTQIATEVTNRNAAIAVETTNRTNADTALSTSITNETTARTAADALKANLAGGNTFTTGKQTLAAPAAGFASMNLPGSATAPTTPAVGDLWLGTGNIHPRFVDNTSTTQNIAFTSDITSASTAANTYTDTQVAAEATARTAADSTESAARIAGDASTLSSANTYTDTSVGTEATARVAGDAAAVTSANTFTTTAVGTEATARVAGDAASVTTANSYTDTQNALNAKLGGGNAFTGGKQVLAATAAGYASLNLPNSATTPTTLAIGDIWLGTGDLHPQFVDNTSTTQNIAFTSDITAASGAANTYTDTQVAAEATARVAGDAAAVTSANTFTTTAVGTEATARIAGDAASVTSANTYTDTQNALNAKLDGGNTFTGGKQVLAATAAGYASLNLPDSATTPTTLAIGDLWLGTGDVHPQFVDNTTTQRSVAFTSDITAASTSANTYTDNAVAAEASARTSGDANSVTTANLYTDGAVANEASQRLAGDTAAVSAANGFATAVVNAEAFARTNGDSFSVTTANGYTDGAVANEAGQRIAGDAASVSVANGFTNSAIGIEAGARIAGDASSVAAANAFTNAGLALKANLAGGNIFTGTNDFADVSSTGAVDFSGATSTKAFRSVSTLPDPNTPLCTIGEIVFAQDTLLVSVCKDVSGVRSWVLVNTATSNTGVLVGNGAGGVNQVTGGLNQVLQWNGSNWVAATVAGTGTVTSVGFSAPADFTVTNSPITGTGTIALGWTAGEAPSSANSAGAIVKRDGSGNFGAGTITATSFNGQINGGAVPVSAGIVGTNGSAQFVAVGTTGSGSVVLASSPTLVAPNIGVASATSLSASGAVSGSTVTATTGFLGSLTGNVTGSISGGTVSGSTVTATTGFVGPLTGNVTGSISGGTVSGSTLTSTVSTGTAPLTVTSTTPVANLTTVPATYSAGGTQQTGVHIVSGSATLTAGANPRSIAITFSGSAAFTNATSYFCTAADVSNAVGLKITLTSGTSFTITNSANAQDVVNYICIGN